MDAPLSYSNGFYYESPDVWKSPNILEYVQKVGGFIRQFLFCILFCIRKTCLYNVDPLKPHFYIVKLGFAGVYIIFLISAQKHRLWVLIRTASLRQF